VKKSEKTVKKVLPFREFCLYLHITLKLLVMNKISKFSPIYNTAFCVFFIWVAYGTAAGTIQQYIKFAGIDNEIAFCCAAMMLGAMYFYLSVSDIYDVIKRYLQNK
jgi:hypothetical protein